MAALVLAPLLGTSAPAQQQSQPQKPSEPGFRVRVTTEIVLVNVIARDKKGNLIRDLKQSDFTVYEDGQKQQIASFDFENVDALQTAGAVGETITIKDTRSLELRLQGTNIFNTPYFSGLNTTVNSLQFGEITSVSNMRRIAMVARFRF